MAVMVADVIDLNQADSVFDNRSDNRFENRGHRSDSRFDRSERFDKKPRFKDDKPKI